MVAQTEGWIISTVWPNLPMDNDLVTKQISMNSSNVTQRKNVSLICNKHWVLVLEELYSAVIAALSASYHCECMSCSQLFSSLKKWSVISKHFKQQAIFNKSNFFVVCVSCGTKKSLLKCHLCWEKRKKSMGTWF